VDKQSQIAPWLMPLWKSLDFAHIPNAILLRGQSGIGKFAFSVEFAKALLCENSHAAMRPCNKCEACHWFDTGNHPDFISLVPETHRKLLLHADYDSDEMLKKSKSTREENGEASETKEKKNISIEETRNAIENLAIGSHRGGNRVILIYPLEMLRTDSANTLLKSLEEPSANTIFILLADRVDRVLPTIRSRCRLLLAPRPDRTLGLAWLKNQLNSIAGLKMNEGDLETVYDEQGGAPFSALNSLIASHQKDDKDELTISIQASRYLLQSMAQGARINWLEAAEKTHKAEFAYLLGSMQRWASDLQSISFGGNPRYYPKHLAILQGLAKSIHTPKLLYFWKLLTQARRHENHPLANRIQLEALLAQYQQIFGM